MVTKIRKTKGKFEPHMTMRNVRRAGDIDIVTIPVSMPLTMKLKLDSYAKRQERSAFICNLIRQQFASENETDPRYLMSKAQEELELWKKEREYELKELKAKHIEQIKTFKVKTESKIERLQEKISELKPLAEAKNLELLKR